MKVGDEVYLRDDPTVKGVINLSNKSGFLVSWEPMSSGFYKESELILASEYEKENMKDEPKGHPNASILMEIAKEAAINPEYWKEFQFYGNNFRWEPLNDEDDLLGAVGSDWEVRRKPRTIRIGNYDVPEPNDFGVNWDRELLIKFETKEGAELMLKALQELLAGK